MFLFGNTDKHLQENVNLCWVANRILGKFCINKQNLQLTTQTLISFPLRISLVSLRLT